MFTTVSMSELMCIADPWWRLPTCHVICLCTIGHKTEKHVLMEWKTWSVLPLNIWSSTVAPKVSCLYVFYQRVLFIFHFSQPLGIFLTQKQHTWENKSSRQQWPTPNFECLAAKQVMFASSLNLFFPHMYTLRCNWWYYDSEQIELKTGKN